MLILKFHDLVTVGANQVIVVWVIQEVRIVMLILLPQIDLMQKPTLYEKCKRPIHRGSRSRRIVLASTFPQFICREMLLRRESSLHNPFSLRRLTKPFLFQKDLESILDVLKLHR